MRPVAAPVITSPALPGAVIQLDGHGASAPRHDILEVLRPPCTDPAAQ